MSTYPTHVKARRTASSYAAFRADPRAQNSLKWWTVDIEARAQADKLIWQECAQHLRVAEETATHIGDNSGGASAMLRKAYPLASAASAHAYIAAAYSLVGSIACTETRAKAHKAVRLTSAYVRAKTGRAS